LPKSRRESFDCDSFQQLMRTVVAFADVSYEGEFKDYN
jgi:hypothetical protein